MRARQVLARRDIGHEDGILSGENSGVQIQLTPIGRRGVGNSRIGAAKIETFAGTIYRGGRIRS